MATRTEESWHIKRRADVCAGTGLPFADQEEIMTRLLIREGELLREDYSLACWDEQNLDHGLSAWKNVYHKPAPPEEPVKKENAETLLRKLVTLEDTEHLNAIYILALMLERKKILVEKEVQIRNDQTKIRIYEHKKSGDTFLVIDPELKLSEIEPVQEEVVALLGGKPPKTETVYQFETVINHLTAQHEKVLFPRRPIGFEIGIAQKIAACFFAQLGGKKNPHYAEADKLFTRYETTEPWSEQIDAYRDLLERIPQEIRFQGLEKPAVAQALRALAEQEAPSLADVQALFAGDDPRIGALRERVLAAARAVAARPARPEAMR